jgi:hypothetical protein
VVTVSVAETTSSVSSRRYPATVTGLSITPPPAQPLSTKVIRGVASALRKREQIQVRLDGRGYASATDRVGADEYAAVVRSDQLNIRAARFHAGIERVGDCARVIVDEDADEPELGETVEQPGSGQARERVPNVRRAKAARDVLR